MAVDWLNFDYSFVAVDCWPDYNCYYIRNRSWIQNYPVDDLAVVEDAFVVNVAVEYYLNKHLMRLMKVNFVDCLDRLDCSTETTDSPIRLMNSTNVSQVLGHLNCSLKMSRTVA